MTPIFLALVLIGTAGVVIAAREARRRGLDRWLVPYLLRAVRGRRRAPGEPIHLLLCIADHYEPLWNGAPGDVADARIATWLREYPRRFAGFRDSDGRPPRHTFFYPIDQYVPAHAEALAGLCRDGFGEVEVHLHHDGDTSDALRATLTAHKVLMARRHGLGARDRGTGELVYAFIHGDWALDNSRPDGRCCGVNDELDVLRETGCYADFTMPSYPSPTQTRKINSIYYATDDPRRPKSHDAGVDLGAGPAPEDALLLIQGPLALDWGRRKWGLFPRVENGCIQGNQPAHIARLGAWLNARIQVATRPDWFFVKLHTHGAPEANHRALLGEPMVEFHRALAIRAAADPGFHFHYVTAREMYNLAKAAEAGWRGSVAAARDFRLTWDRGEVVAAACSTSRGEERSDETTGMDQSA
jgi:hypothetical protein